MRLSSTTRNRVPSVEELARPIEVFNGIARVPTESVGLLRLPEPGEGDLVSLALAAGLYRYHRYVPEIVSSRDCG